MFGVETDKTGNFVQFSLFIQSRESEVWLWTCQIQLQFIYHKNSKSQ